MSIMIDLRFSSFSWHGHHDQSHPRVHSLQTLAPEYPVDWDAWF